MPGKRPFKSQDGLTFVLVVLAACVLEAARSETIDTMAPHVASLVATVLLSWLANGQLQRSSRTDDAKERRTPGLIAGAFVLAVVQEFVFRRFGWGQDLHFALLNVMRNLMFVLAGMVILPQAPRLAAGMSLFLVTGAMALATTTIAQLLGLLYGMIGVWWLLGAHWEQLRGHFPTESRRETPRTIAGALAGVVSSIVILVSLSLSGANLTTSVLGFMPTSGGDRGADEFATRGVNDGDNLVGAEKDADSFGAVESQLFLDSEMPSLYDMLSDMYGDEIKKRSTERAVALANPNPTLSHRHLHKTEKSGREFGMVRHRPRRAQELAKRTADAILYVQGRVPLHLALESYDEFDGRVWSHSPNARPTAQLNLALDSHDKPWIRVARPSESQALSDIESHRLKLIRLKTNRIPTPSHLSGIHIDKINRLDFFDLSSDGVLSMRDRSRVPPLTVAHIESRTAAVERLTEQSFAARSLPDFQRYLQLPEVPSGERLERLAADWTAGTPRGWPQIERIRQYLKAGFQLDRSTTIDEQSDDPVGDFLFETRRGPDYLFASSAALMLRSLGYPTRVVSGVYVNPARYDARARHTEVLPDDVHFWAEVCADGSTWITVEASPGYEVLQPRVSWWRQIWSAFALALRRAASHPFLLASAGVSLLLAYRLRGHIVDLVASAWWRLPLRRSPQQVVFSTVRLLERRAALAGVRRPPTTPLRRHYLPLTRLASKQEGALLDETVALAIRALYAPSAALPADPVRRLCKDAIRCWTAPRMRALARAGTPIEAYDKRKFIRERP